MKTWYQLYYFDYIKDKIITYGFSITGNIITDHPDKYVWQGENKNTFKAFICNYHYFQVVKICDQVN